MKSINVNLSLPGLEPMTFRMAPTASSRRQTLYPLDHEASLKKEVRKSVHSSTDCHYPGSIPEFPIRYALSIVQYCEFSVALNHCK